MAQLFVTNGTDHLTVDLSDQTVTLGRSPQNTVVLDREPTVSRFHARLEPTAKGWVLHDLDSRNGTFVNGTRISAPTPLGAGDQAKVGGYQLSIRGDAELGQTIDASATQQARRLLELGLTARELEVIALVAQGRSDQAIADQLFISVKTVQSHLDRIGEKIGHRRRPELIRFATDHGLA